jgi:hypothetical protein
MLSFNGAVATCSATCTGANYNSTQDSYNYCGCISTLNYIYGAVCSAASITAAFCKAESVFVAPVAPVTLGTCSFCKYYIDQYSSVATGMKLCTAAATCPTNYVYYVNAQNISICDYTCAPGQDFSLVDGTNTCISMCTPAAPFW